MYLFPEPVIYMFFSLQIESVALWHNHTYQPVILATSDLVQKRVTSNQAVTHGELQEACALLYSIVSCLADFMR